MECINIWIIEKKSEENFEEALENVKMNKSYNEQNLHKIYF